MAYSYVQYPGNGSTTNFSFSFGYLSKDHVTVKVDSVDVSFTWLTDFSVQVTPAPAAGTLVEIRRNTPLDQPAVDWVDGSTLTEADMDLDSVFNLYANQEARDYAEATVQLDPEGVWDGRGRSTTNFAAPIDNTSLVTKGYFDDVYKPSLDDLVDQAEDARDAAQGYAAAADNSADTAATLVGLFRGQYLGAQATDPLVDGNGQPVTPGDLYFNTTANEMRVVSASSGWIPAGSAVEGVLKRPPGGTPILATAGQTIVPVVGGYDSGFILVLLNGVAMSSPDVDTNSGEDIVFATPLAENDEVDYFAFGAFTVADAVGRVELADASNPLNGAALVGYTPPATAASSADTVKESLDDLHNGNWKTPFGSASVGVWYRPGTNYESAGTVVKTESRPFLHDYRPLGTAHGGTAVFSTDGGNIFVGPGAGNFTMAPVAIGDLPPGKDYNLQCSHNQGFGIQSLSSLTIGYKNVGYGTNSLRKLTEGHGNTAVGRDAGHELLTGNENCLFGFTAGQLLQSGTYNTGIGTASLYNNTAGQGNTGVGRRAMFDRASGDYNTAVGENAGWGHLSGSYNILIGKQAANNGVTTGGSCTIIGSRISGLPNVDGMVVLADGAGNKYLNIQPNGTAASLLDLPSRNADAVNLAATDGQVNSGSTIFLRSLANIGNAVTQIVFQSRQSQPYSRIVSSGGATPYLAFVNNNAETMRFDSSGNMRIKGAAGPVWTSGAGSPEGVLTAPVGSLYTRTDGGAGSTLYVKESGTGATGWVAK